MASGMGDSLLSTDGQVGSMPVDPVEAFLAYSFSTDAVFQQGLESIVASGALEGKSEEERAVILRSSQVFYFNRAIGCSITMDEVNERERSRQLVPATNAVNSNGHSDDPAVALSTQQSDVEPRTLSFSELKALIEQGKTDQIPNNRQIPNELNQATPSQSTTGLRRKPWEAET
ncbi:uncharacterized protein C8Q71DRAFT_361185 [Rhodofomes roseus]|uniref:Uncharacterized protein n=1 Tax=Rhodofomes roseus TaxID=34475 RepID=A0ABQ8K1R9_9APHY|nr:uncharacterized protein C8Q71DRAFT_361185 [Rhodofomes roseus]KAH9830617.1 hypothetical protein C8Q71DRAFT_361185 [Rhodofomes roseus]